MQERADQIEKGPAAVLPLEAKAAVIVREGRALLDRIDYSLSRAPRITVVLGPNGAGKSLLVRVLGGLIRPDTGLVTWAGTAPDRARARGVGVVFQRPVLLRRSVEENITFALGVAEVPRAERAGKAFEMLSAAGLAQLSKQDATTLSAGEQQRLCLARAVACGPQVLLLDEPTANLDPASTVAIERQLLQLRTLGMPILFVTHDLAQARRIADAIVFMHQGKICERSEARAFFEMPRTEQAGRFIRGELLT